MARLTPQPLEWPEPKMYFEVGDRVVFRLAYASGPTEGGPYTGLRGTVVEPAPISIMTGVMVDWDNGVTSTVSGFQATKLSLLELLGEI